MKLILFSIRINHTVVTVFILQLLHAFSIKPFIIIITIQRRVLESSTQNRIVILLLYVDRKRNIKKISTIKNDKQKQEMPFLKKM